MRGTRYNFNASLRRLSRNHGVKGSRAFATWLPGRYEADAGARTPSQINNSSVFYFGRRGRKDADKQAAALALKATEKPSVAGQSNEHERISCC